MSQNFHKLIQNQTKLAANQRKTVKVFSIWSPIDSKWEVIDSKWKKSTPNATPLAKATNRSKIALRVYNLSQNSPKFAFSRLKIYANWREMVADGNQIGC